MMKFAIFSFDKLTKITIVPQSIKKFQFFRVSPTKFSIFWIFWSSINKTSGFCMSDRRNFLFHHRRCKFEFFHAPSTKLGIFSCPMKKMFIFLMSDQQISRFSSASLTKLVNYPCPFGEICYSLPHFSGKIVDFPMPNQRNLRILSN